MYGCYKDGVCMCVPRSRKYVYRYYSVQSVCVCVGGGGGGGGEVVCELRVKTGCEILSTHPRSTTLPTLI